MTNLVRICFEAHKSHKSSVQGCVHTDTVQHLWRVHFQLRIANGKWQIGSIQWAIQRQRSSQIENCRVILTNYDNCLSTTHSQSTQRLNCLCFSCCWCCCCCVWLVCLLCNKSKSESNAFSFLFCTECSQRRAAKAHRQSRGIRHALLWHKTTGSTGRHPAWNEQQMQRLP